MQDSDSEKPQFDFKKLTRRNFFKGAGLLATSLVVGTEPIIEPASALSTLMDRVRRDPSEKNKQLMQDWLLFNAAEYKNRAVGNHLTALTLHHFLYGKGEPLDVSDDYRNAAISQTQRCLQTSQMLDRLRRPGEVTDDEALAIYFGMTLSERGAADYGASEHHPLEVSGVMKDEFLAILDARLSDNRKLTISGVCSNGLDHLDYSTIGDINTSLGRHRLKVGGTVLASHQYQDTGESWIEGYRSLPLYEIFDDDSFWPLHDVRFMPSSPVEIYDKYDFHKPYNHDLFGSRYNLTNQLIVDSLLEPIPLERKRKFERSEQIVEFLESHGIDINVPFRHHEAGLSLVENGLAHFYDIHGNIAVNQPITFALSPKLLVADR